MIRLAACFAFAALLGAAPMNARDRQRLVAHLEMTERWLAEEVGALTPEQAKWRASDTTWSVLDVVDHLTVAEPQYWTWLKEAMSDPEGYKSDVSDADILWYGVDRTQRQRTAEAREPKGKHDNVRDALAGFRKLRAEMLQYAKSTEDDLRGHKMRQGKMDAYQWFLMISAHSQRHLLQLREVKANAKFPK